MPINITETFAQIAAQPVLAFIADLELSGAITTAEANAGRENLAKDVANAADYDALTDVIGNWMIKLTDYSALRSDR